MFEYEFKKTAEEWREFPDWIIYIGTELEGSKRKTVEIASSYETIFDSLWRSGKIDKEKFYEAEYCFQKATMMKKGLTEEEAEEAIENGECDSLEFEWSEEEYKNAILNFKSELYGRMKTVSEVLENGED